KAEFEAQTGGMWPLNIGQIYTTLDRLERDGLINKQEVDEQGRQHYVITDTGRSDVAAWFAQPLELQAPPRNELAIKLSLAIHQSGVDVETLIQHQRTATMHALQTLNHAKRSAADEEISWLLLVEQRILNAESELRWLDFCERTLARQPAAQKPIPAQLPTREVVR
ncbi:MAG: PadR family transcriptional regulator, partial [Propionibacteriaceae bacterium]